MGTHNSRAWVWRAYAVLAGIAVVLIAISSTLRVTIHEPWAQVLGSILQVATIMGGGLGSLAIKRRRLALPAEE